MALVTCVTSALNLRGLGGAMGGWCHGWPENTHPRDDGPGPTGGAGSVLEDVDGWLDEHAAGQYSRNADLSPARPTYWIMT
jgi:hypothetical protein